MSSRNTGKNTNASGADSFSVSVLGFEECEAKPVFMRALGPLLPIRKGT